ncbi:MAG: hypothetical protein K0R41_4691 [Geminicoccaceae bacterium]|nr:hypothetical protein [Solirubrobacterales bacterium]MCE3250866.1 hypothetical protein [Geminicoccaceae bacterium]
MARDDADAGRRREALGRELVAHGANRRDRRADEDDSLGRERLGEGGVLGEEAVARVNRLGAAQPGRLDDALDPQITLAGGRRPDRQGLVGHAHVQRVGIGLGVDRDRGDAEPPAGPDDPAGDLAPIGDQELLEHGRPGSS